jgi:hypothetical protein
VLGCRIPLDPEHALVVAELTGAADELVDYDDAGRAVRRWFAAMAEPGGAALTSPTRNQRMPDEGRRGDEHGARLDFGLTDNPLDHAPAASH